MYFVIIKINRAENVMKKAIIINVKAVKIKNNYNNNNIHIIKKIMFIDLFT